MILKYLGSAAAFLMLFGVLSEFSVQAEEGPTRDPNLDPNETFVRLAASLEDRDGRQREPSGQKVGKYWQRRYHRQVTGRMFLVMNYPYGPAGNPYGGAVAFSDPAPQWYLQAVLGQSDPNAIESADPSHTAQGAPDAATAVFRQVQQTMENCCDLIHRWRDMNESAGTALEIVRATELTKTATGIYLDNPQLAVVVKRTLGRISSVNRKFDLASRRVVRNLLAGRIDKTLTARLEKQLADLEALLEQLARQNDQISIALGMGPIDRESSGSAGDEPITYSKDRLPAAP